MNPKQWSELGAYTQAQLINGPMYRLERMQNTPRPNRLRCTALQGMLGTGPVTGPGCLDKWLSTRPGALQRIGRQE